MKNELQIFKGHEVEVFEYNGVILFNPRHVGEVLGMAYRTVTEHVKEMNENKKIVMKNSNCGSTALRKFANRGETFITESGVYDLIFKSRKPEAIEFKDWVTDEVLPTIRKTGGYISNAELMVDTYFGSLDDARKTLVKGLFENIEEQQKLIVEQKNTIETQQAVLEIQAPKVEMYDEFMESDGTYTPTKLGKKLKFRSAQAFNNFLVENNLIYKDKRTGEWIAKAHLPSYTHKYVTVPYSKFGQIHYKEVLRFTPKMIEYLVNEEYVEFGDVV